MDCIPGSSSVFKEFIYSSEGTCTKNVLLFNCDGQGVGSFVLLYLSLEEASGNVIIVVEWG